MPPANILLIRHGESSWNAEGRWQGHADPPLSPRGTQQAAKLAWRLVPWFDDVTLQAVVSSDLQRAHATAAAIADANGLTHGVDPGLREIDVGSWSGKTREEVEAAEPGALDVFFSGGNAWIGGETHEQHELRCAEMALRLDAWEDVDDGLVVVSHGGTVRALGRTLLGIDHAHRARFSGIQYATVTRLMRGPDQRWRLVTWGEHVVPLHAGQER